MILSFWQVGNDAETSVPPTVAVPNFQVKEVINSVFVLITGSSSFSQDDKINRLRKVNKRVWLFFIWAASIAYTQVYVGVHYPFDVLCGALLGMALGTGMAKMFHKQIGILSLE